MFNSCYKHGMGKTRFKNFEFSLWITLTGARLDGERYIRHVNTELFLLFTYVIRLKTDVQECLGLERIHAVLNLTRSVFCCCWASCENWHKCANEFDMMCWRTLHQTKGMRELALWCTNELLLVPTNDHIDSFTWLLFVKQHLNLFKYVQRIWFKYF